MVDTEKLLLAMKITEEAANDGLWNQRKWLVQTECGTAGCFAGNWALHQGCTPSWGKYADTGIVVQPNGRPAEIWDFVQNDLGLSRDQAANLFAVGNTIESLRVIVDAIVAEAN